MDVDDHEQSNNKPSNQESKSSSSIDNDMSKDQQQQQQQSESSCSNDKLNESETYQQDESEEIGGKEASNDQRKENNTELNQNDDNHSSLNDSTAYENESLQNIEEKQCSEDTQKSYHQEIHDETANDASNNNESLLSSKDGKEVPEANVEVGTAAAASGSSNNAGTKTEMTKTSNEPQRTTNSNQDSNINKEHNRNMTENNENTTRNEITTITETCVDDNLDGLQYEEGNRNFGFGQNHALPQEASEHESRFYERYKNTINSETFIEMNNVCNEDTSVSLTQHNDSTLGSESQQNLFMYGYRESISAEDGGFTSENGESEAEIRFRKKGGNHDTSGEDDMTAVLSHLLVAEGGLEDGVEDWDRLQTVMTRARSRFGSSPKSTKHFKTYMFVVIASTRLKVKKKTNS